MKVKRSTKEGAGLFSNVLFLLGIFIVLQYLAYKHPKEWDLTKNKQFSLSDLSHKELGSLKDNLDLWGFVSNGDSFTHDLLHQYEVASTKVRVHYVDPNAEPAKAQEFGLNAPPPIIVIEYQNRKEQVSEPSEEKITNAINRLTSGVQRTLYFVQGHGEMDPTSPDPRGYSTLKDSLQGENYTWKLLSVVNTKEIPEDASLLIFLDPRDPMFKHEDKLFSDYLNQGGRIFFLCGLDTHPSWIHWLEQFGFKIGDNLIADPRMTIVGLGPEVLVVNNYSPFPITEPLRSGKEPTPTILPLTRSVESQPKTEKGITISSLVSTSPMGTAIPIKIEGKKVLENREKSTHGAFSVAAVGTLEKNKDKPGRLVVTGSNYFATNQWINNAANRDFALNIVSWLTENNNTISIRPKADNTSPFMLDSNAIIRLFLLSIIALPSFGIALGLGTWLRRRHL